jgi:hypothetical protein
MADSITIQNNNFISFLQLVPNSDKNIIDILENQTLQILNQNQMFNYSDSIDDLTIEINNYFKIYKNKNPINEINQYFENNDLSQIKSKYYDIITFDQSDDLYHLMLIDININSIAYLNNLTIDQKQNKFNLIASNLVKYHSNSIAIFGDVFLISINKCYYDLLLKSDEVISKSNLTKLEQFNTIQMIYSNYNLFNFIKSFANIFYVKIFIQPTNVFVHYSRNILHNFIQNNIYEIIMLNIIKIKYQDIILYIKYIDELPNSHHSIVNMIQKQDILNNILNNYYLIDLINTDINFLKEINVDEIIVAKKVDEIIVAKKVDEIIEAKVDEIIVAKKVDEIIEAKVDEIIEAKKVDEIIEAKKVDEIIEAKVDEIIEAKVDEIIEEVI